MKIISNFRGEYEFLSNFYYSPFVYKGYSVSTAEHAFQLAKTVNLEEREYIANTATPGEAKKEGRKVKLIPEWEWVKNAVMLDVLRAKFTQHDDLAASLEETGGAVLLENNLWHDNYWGNCTCSKCVNKIGLNRLGYLLSLLRGEFLLKSLNRAAIFKYKI